MIRTFINFLSALFGAQPDPVTSPWHKAPDVPRRRGDALPPNVVYYAGRPFVSEEVEPCVYEDTRLRQGAIRSAEVTATDKRIMQAQKLDAEKYAELKVLWTRGMSAAAAAKQFRGRAGYGNRTIEKYWAAFNSTAKSPSPGPE